MAVEALVGELGTKCPRCGAFNLPRCISCNCKLPRSVMQDWTLALSFMQQSVLITCVRGCDGLPKQHVSKYMLRWYRRCIMYSAFDKVVLIDPHDSRGGNFTGPIPFPNLDELAKAYLKSVDEVPHHFQLHLIHAAEIIGYKHPTPSIRSWWNRFYLGAVKDFHMFPETEAQLDFRLGDSQDQWQDVGGEELTGRFERK